MHFMFGSQVEFLGVEGADRTAVPNPRWLQLECQL